MYRQEEQPMFMGTYYNSIDAKNRVIVPSKHRDELGGRCVLTKGLDTCLYIYTMSDWEKQLTKIEQLPESDPEIRAFIRSFFGSATECEFDKQGRIVIPAPLISYARITKELVTVGAMKKIEIWSKELWEAPGEDIRLSTEEIAGALEKYNF
jgi:MraZ protein